MTISSYKTIAESGYAEFKDKGSRFLAFAYPVIQADDVKQLLAPLYKEHFKAVHHCYAYRLGIDGTHFRANDDGEPSGSAGRPILNQIDSFELTDIVVIVVRYFGGTLLGVPGLINAYKTVTKEVLSSVKIIEKPVPVFVEIVCNYPHLSEVLRLLTLAQAQIIEQDLQLDCRIKAVIPLANFQQCESALKKNWEIQIKKLGVDE